MFCFWSSPEKKQRYLNCIKLDSFDYCTFLQCIIAAQVSLLRLESSLRAALLLTEVSNELEDLQSTFSRSESSKGIHSISDELCCLEPLVDSLSSQCGDRLRDFVDSIQRTIETLADVDASLQQYGEQNMALSLELRSVHCTEIADQKQLVASAELVLSSRIQAIIQLSSRKWEYCDFEKLHQCLHPVIPSSADAEPSESGVRSQERFKLPLSQQMANTRPCHGGSETSISGLFFSELMGSSSSQNAVSSERSLSRVCAKPLVDETALKPLSDNSVDSSEDSETSALFAMRKRRASTSASRSYTSSSSKDYIGGDEGSVKRAARQSSPVSAVVLGISQPITVAASVEEMVDPQGNPTETTIPTLAKSYVGLMSSPGSDCTVAVHSAHSSPSPQSSTTTSCGVFMDEVAGEAGELIISERLLEDGLHHDVIMSGPDQFESTRTPAFSGDKTSLDIGPSTLGSILGAVQGDLSEFLHARPAGDREVSCSEVLRRRRGQAWLLGDTSSSERNGGIAGGEAADSSFGEVTDLPGSVSKRLTWSQNSENSSSASANNPSAAEACEVEEGPDQVIDTSDIGVEPPSRRHTS